MADEDFYSATGISADAVMNDDDEVIVSMNNIHKTYLLGVEGVPALRGVSLTIKKGEFVVIFGTSGGGKTTMLNIMGTIDKPTKGEMYLCGQKITSKTKDSDLSILRLKKIGFVFQTFNLLSSLTAQENVEMPIILHGQLSAAQRSQRAISLLTQVGMKDRLDHLPSQLSGGEQQRVTIARAIANKPEILLLDEPTGDLDTYNTCVVVKLLTELNKKDKITLIMVTHDVHLKSFADRIIWMRDGKIQRVETVDPARKADALRKLDDTLEELKQNRNKDAPPVMQNEIRNPADYPTFSKEKSLQQRDMGIDGKESTVRQRPRKKLADSGNFSNEGVELQNIHIDSLSLHDTPRANGNPPPQPTTTLNTIDTSPAPSLSNRDSVGSLGTSYGSDDDNWLLERDHRKAVAAAANEKQ